MFPKHFVRRRRLKKVLEKALEKTKTFSDQNPQNSEFLKLKDTLGQASPSSTRGAFRIQKRVP